MQAVIMAGGFGTRLRPLTCNIPKPMVPLLNKPLIEHNIELLKSHNIKELIVILYYQAEVIKDYFGDGRKFGVDIRYVTPDADYGTAGAVHCAREHVKDTFIIISGDVVTDIDLGKAVSFHNRKKSAATLILTHSKVPLQFGIVLTDKDGRITKFFEKPGWSEVFSDTINTGIYILNKQTLELVKEATPPDKQDTDFSKDLFPYLLRQKLPLYGCIENGYWKDVGSLEDYISTNMDALKGRIKIPSLRNASKDGCMISKSSVIDKNASIISSVVGNKCKIGPEVRVKNSVIWDGVIIEEGCSLSGDVLCNGVTIKPNAKLSENVFIGDDVRIGGHALIKPDVKVWPEKIIDGNSIVSKNLIWEERWRESFFTDSRITGLANIEITPEFASKLGMMYGVFAGIGAKINISRDINNISLMIKGAIISGLMSSGIAVNDFETMPIPILRQELKSGAGDGGIFVRKSPFDASKCDIIFFDSTGKDLSTAKTKSIERLFISSDSRPIPFERIGSLKRHELTYGRYKKLVMSHINKDVINGRHFKIAVNYSHGITSTIFPLILSELDLELVSLDAHLDPLKQTRSPEEFQAALKKLSYVVTSLKYDAGFLLDAGGEKIFMVDNTGKIISYDRFLSIIINLFLSLYPETPKIAVPIQASGEIDIVAKNCGTVIIRVKDSHYAMMNASGEEGVGLVGGTKGGVIFPEFLFATDGMYSVVKILELIAMSGQTLSGIEKQTPRLHMAKNNIYCTKEMKGKIMRKLVEESEGMERQLIDGIKIFFGEYKWVLCIPDSEREIFHVNAEAKTQREAAKLVKEYTRKIKSYQENL